MDVFVDLHLDLQSTSRNEAIETRTLSVRSPNTGSELLQILEDVLHIPACLTTLEIQSVIVKAETDLSNFKLRDGDTIKVRYFSQADCPEIKECIEKMLQLLDDFKRWKEKKIVNVVSCSEARTIGCLQNLWGFHFSSTSWHKKEANKFYFVSEGGLDVVSQLMDILFTTPSNELPREITRHKIETAMLDILWKLAIDDTFWLPLVQSGAVENCLQALLRVSVSNHAPLHEHFKAEKDVVCSSLGLLACFCEIPEVRHLIASNSKAIKQMLAISTCPSFSGVDVHRIIMIFIGLSYNPATHSHLLSHDAFSEFIENESSLYRMENGVLHNTLMRYHKAVLLAILLLSSPQFFSNEKKKFVCQVLDTFVKANCHQMLSQFEMLCGIYWGTSAPLIKVLYEVKKPELEADIFDTCKLTILLAMKTLVAKQSHHSVLAKEEMIDYLVCLPWHSEGELKDSATELVSMIRQVPDLHYKPPSLLNMSKATVSMYFCGLHDVVRLSVPELVSNLYPAVNPI